MKILGFDTSGKTLSIAIANDEEIIAEISINSKITHSQTLMPNIEKILKEVNINIKEIDVYSFSKGPGSFTGLRIGAATAKALAYANEKKIMGISSLEILKNNYSEFRGIIVPLIDARNNRIFGSAYKSDKIIIEETSEDIFDFLKRLTQFKEEMIFLGDGKIAHIEKIKEILGDRAIISSSKNDYPRAASICQISLERIETNEFDNYFTITPEYLRPSQAERQKNGN